VASRYQKLLMASMGDRPVTRGELLEALAAQKEDLLVALAAQKQDTLNGIRAFFAAEREQTEEIVRNAQTEILKAFLSFQESSNIRFRTIEANLSNTDTGLSERMAVLERRLAEIEKTLLLKPAGRADHGGTARPVPRVASAE